MLYTNNLGLLIPDEIIDLWRWETSTNWPLKKT